MRTPKTRAARAERDVSHAVTTLYQMHYRSLVRLAALLVSDLATAENIVQESFTALHGMRRTLPDADAGLCFLRRSVVRRSRSAPRLQPGAHPTCRVTARRPTSPLRAPPSSRRCQLFPSASVRYWFCGISLTCPRPRSPRRPGSGQPP